MKRKTGFYALGLLVTAGALSIACSGDDGNGDSGGTSGSSTSGANTGGTPSASGNSSGGNNTSGTNNTAGSNNNSGSNNGGNNNAGTNNNGGNNNQGGDGGPDPQGGGGNIGGPCADGVEDGADCEQGDGICELPNGDTCVCPPFGQNPNWNCGEVPGQGGGGPGGGDVTCPDNAMDEDACTGGPGLCPGQQCFCDGDDMVNCFN